MQTSAGSTQSSPPPTRGAIGFGKLGYSRRYGPLDATLEHCVEDLILVADKRRLATKPTTKHFADIWATFRQHHENLDGCYK